MSAARRAGSVPTAVRAAARDRVGVVSLGCPKNLVDTEIMLGELERRGYRIVADPSTPLLAAYDVWKKLYAGLADGFGAGASPTEWEALERDLFAVIGLDTLLAVERATVEKKEGS